MRLGILSTINARTRAAPFSFGTCRIALPNRHFFKDLSKIIQGGTNTLPKTPLLPNDAAAAHGLSGKWLVLPRRTKDPSSLYSPLQSIGPQRWDRAMADCSKAFQSCKGTGGPLVSFKGADGSQAANQHACKAHPVTVAAFHPLFFFLAHYWKGRGGEGERRGAAAMMYSDEDADFRKMNRCPEM